MVAQFKSLLKLLAGGFVAWKYGAPLAGKLAAWWPFWPFDQSFIPGYLIAFLLGNIGAGLVLSLFGGTGLRFSKGGGWGLTLRPLKGQVAELVLGSLAVAVWIYLVFWLELAGYAFNFLAATFPTVDRHKMAVGLTVLLFVFPPVLLFTKGETWENSALRFIGRNSAGVRKLLRISGFGRGGSGAFAGMLSEWESLYRDGDILLGGSSYNGNRRVGVKDDRHLLTIAATGGGKGRTAIIPNLLLWKGSALVIDPKGTNAAVTALARGQGGGRVTKSLGQSVYVVDPFGELSKQGIAIQGACFNPLLDLDPASPRIFEDIEAVADGLVLPEKGETHWSEKARGIVAGTVAHVLTTEPPETRTLMRVRDFLLSTSPDELQKVLTDMLCNDLAAKLAQEAAADILRAEGSAEMRSIQSTVQKNLKWLLSPNMREVFSRSDFSLRDLKEKPTTIYLVLPPEEIHNHSRFLRLFVSLGLRTMLKREEGQPPPRQKVLFVLDEFLALGRMDSMLTALNVGRSYGLKVWPIAQNVNGLAELYGDNWQTFVDGAGAVQVFSIGNKPSAQFLADMLDQQVIVRPVPRDGGGVSYQLTAVPLRTGPELQEQTDRELEKQIVLRPGKQAFYLNRLKYDKAFTKDRFAPDPDHAGS